jgi:hypothetical protein
MAAWSSGIVSAWGQLDREIESGEGIGWVIRVNQVHNYLSKYFICLWIMDAKYQFIRKPVLKSISVQVVSFQISNLAYFLVLNWFLNQFQVENLQIPVIIHLYI